MRNEKEMEPLISLDHVTYRYPFTGRDAVTDISIDVKPGEAVLVTGVSGCGKTTLIRLINGLAPGYYGGKVTGMLRGYRTRAARFLRSRLTAGRFSRTRRTSSSR